MCHAVSAMIFFSFFFFFEDDCDRGINKYLETNEKGRERKRDGEEFKG